MTEDELLEDVKYWEGRARAAEAELFEARQAILKEGMERNDAIAALKPFATVADACDYFKNLPGHHICSWRIKGERIYGPTADDCRHARTIVLRASRTADHVGSPKEVSSGS